MFYLKILKYYLFSEKYRHTMFTGDAIMPVNSDFHIEIPLRNLFPENSLKEGICTDHEKGSIIPFPSGENAGFYIVVSGLVRLLGMTPKEERKLLFIATRGFFLYDNYFFCNIQPMSIAEVIRPTRVVYLSKNSIIKLLHTDNEFLYCALYNGFTRGALLGQDLVNACHIQFDQYLLHLLYYIKDLEGKECRNGIELAITNDELADLAGCSRISIVRWLKKLEMKGILIKSRRKLLFPNT